MEPQRGTKGEVMIEEKRNGEGSALSTSKSVFPATSTSNKAYTVLNKYRESIKSEIKSLEKHQFPSLPPVLQSLRLWKNVAIVFSDNSETNSGRK